MSVCQMRASNGQQWLKELVVASAKISMVRVLAILQIFIGIGAVPVGYMFIVDPTGAVELLLGWRMNPNMVRNLMWRGS